MVTLLSPAKVNYFLHVVGIYPDGRPEVASLSQAVNLCDVMQFSLSGEDELTCSGLPSKHSENCIVKTLELFRRKTGLKKFFKVHLEKKIPFASGLGGRCSNAATALWGLNQLLDRPAAAPELAEWAKEIAIEASFFFSFGTTLANANAQRNIHLNSTLQHPHWIASPHQRIPRTAIFERLRVEDLERRDLEALVQRCIEGKMPSLFNDLEEPVFALDPKLALIKAKLLETGCRHVVMTGAGPSLVCYGEQSPPPIPGVSFLPADPIYRQEGEWYA